MNNSAPEQLVLSVVGKQAELVLIRQVAAFQHGFFLSSYLQDPALIALHDGLQVAK